MKILIQKNKISDSMKATLNNVKMWFSPFVDLEFTEEKTNLKIVNGDYSYLDTLGKTQTFQAVDETWYDENISKPAKARGFDIVVFVIPRKNWISRIVEGFGTSTPDWGIEEIAVPLFTSGTYQFNDVKIQGDKMFWVLVHEILHRIYNIKGLQDNTHKYFTEGKPDKCLEDFRDQGPKAILTRINDNGIQTTGVFDMYNEGKNSICYSLELPWKDNKQNASCIPKGTYKCSIYNSTKYGKVYQIKNVFGRTGILIHSGNFKDQTKGCVLLGSELRDINKDGQKDVTNSKLTLSKMLLFFGGKDFTLIIK